MKNIVSFLIVFVVIATCKGQTGEYVSFGKKITSDNAENVEAALEQYQTMEVGDSLDYKVAAKVTSVCQAKGCWITLNMEDGSEVMVKFKDYGFFMPKDIAGQEVIVAGKAFVNEVSVEELQHYAEDAGKSKEEIAQIKESKKTYSFEAEGVLLKQ